MCCLGWGTIIITCSVTLVLGLVISRMLFMPVTASPTAAPAPHDDDNADRPLPPTMPPGGATARARGDPVIWNRPMPEQRTGGGDTLIWSKRSEYYTENVLQKQAELMKLTSAQLIHICEYIKTPGRR